MEEDRFDAEALVEAMAPMLGLRVTSDQQPGVVLHLRNTARIAQAVPRFRLPERTENAPVFRS
jgi:hypothetical protein